MTMFILIMFALVPGFTSYTYKKVDDIKNIWR